jgi:hypothetical protein
MRMTLLVFVGLVLAILASNSSPQNPRVKSPGLSFSRARVPPVVNMSHAEAVSALEDVGFDHKGIDPNGNSVDCCYEPVRRVIGQHPEAGEELTLGDVVNLTFEPIVVAASLPSSRRSPRAPEVIERERQLRRDMLRSRLEWQRKMREALIEELPGDIIRALGERGTMIPVAESRSVRDLVREKVSLRLREGVARPESIPTSRPGPR